MTVLLACALVVRNLAVADASWHAKKTTSAGRLRGAPPALAVVGGPSSPSSPARR